MRRRLAPRAAAAPPRRRRRRQREMGAADNDGLGFTLLRDSLYLEVLVRDGNVWSIAPVLPSSAPRSMHPISDIAARMRHVHLPRGNETIARHLAERYRISIRAITTLDVGVHRIDRDDGDPWVARVFHEERSIERTESDAALLGYLAEADFPAERLACDNPVSVLDGQSVLVTSCRARPVADGSAPADRLGPRRAREHSGRPTGRTCSSTRAKSSASVQRCSFASCGSPPGTTGRERSKETRQTAPSGGCRFRRSSTRPSAAPHARPFSADKVASRHRLSV